MAVVAKDCKGKQGKKGTKRKKGKKGQKGNKASSQGKAAPASPPPASQPTAAPLAEYIPREYSVFRARWIAARTMELREARPTSRQCELRQAASTEWKDGPVRASLLANVSDKDRKRRRF